MFYLDRVKTLTEENIILLNHIKDIFDVDFIFLKNSHGDNYCLQINKIFEIKKFIDIVYPFVSNIKCMNYKIKLRGRIDIKTKELKDLYPNKKIYTIILDTKNPNNTPLGMKN